VLCGSRAVPSGLEPPRSCRTIPSPPERYSCAVRLSADYAARLAAALLRGRAVLAESLDGQRHDAIVSDASFRRECLTVGRSKQRGA